MVQQCVLNQNWGYWLLLDIFTSIISLVCQMQLDCMGPNSSETQDFDGEFHLFRQEMQKKWYKS